MKGSHGGVPGDGACVFSGEDMGEEQGRRQSAVRAGHDFKAGGVWADCGLGSGGYPTSRDTQAAP